MGGSNVIPFAPVLERFRARQRARLAEIGDPASWADHYTGGGIDELWAGPHAWGSGGVVVSLR